MVDLGALEITPVVWYGIATLLPMGKHCFIIARGPFGPVGNNGNTCPRAIMAIPYHTVGVISNTPKSTIE